MIRPSFVALFALVPSLALAQPDRTAEAEQLFRDGQRAIKDGRIAEACVLFEGSQRLEPNPSTLMNLGDCRERNGQLATAWGLFLQATSALRADARQAATAQSAQRRADLIESRLSYLIVNVPEASRSEGLTITRNGVVIDAVSWNRAIPIDGGTYEIAAKVPGREAWTHRITIAPERDKQSVEVPRFEAVTVAPVEPAPPPVETAPTPPPVESQPEAPLTPEPVDTPSPSSNNRRTIALGVGAVAVASLAAAAYFEVSARGTYDDYLYEPEGPSRDDLFDSANGKRRIAQGLGAAGAIAAGAAAYFWLTGRPATNDGVAIHPFAGAAAGGIVVRGGF